MQTKLFFYGLLECLLNMLKYFLWRCKVDSYATTITPYSKILKKQDDDKLIFVFQFTDGLYYIKYDHNVFATFKIDDITYYRKGIQPKPVKHMCIPIELLVKIM